MVSNHPSPIFYFLIANNNTKKQIGEYIDEYEDDKNLEYINQIKLTSKDILFKEKKEKQKTNKINFPEHNLYYILTNSDIFYFAAIKKNSKYSIQENLIFDLIQDIDNQGIKKLIDKNGNLSRVGNQNLKFSIEQNNIKMKGQNIINEKENKDESKIVILNSQINDINNDVKNSVKNMIVSVNEMNYLDNKSSEIKDISYKFQQSSYDVERKMRNKNCMIKIGFGILAVAGIYLAIKLIF